MKKYAIIIYFLVFIMSLQPVYAYLDPGNGSMVMQLLLGGGAGIALVFRIYWTSILKKLNFIKQFLIK